MLALPAHLGGLGVSDPCKKSTLHYSMCKTISAPLLCLILEQSEAYALEVKEAQARMGNNAQKFHRLYEEQQMTWNKTNPPSCRRPSLFLWERSLKLVLSSTHRWRWVCPAQWAFRNACVCDMVSDLHIYPPTVFVARILPSNMHLAAPRGRYPSIHHNEIWNYTADLLSGVCHSVGTQPSLQYVTWEQFEHETANQENGAQLNIVAHSFCGRNRQITFFDVRVFNPYAPCYQSYTLAQCYWVREEESI